MMRRAGHMAVDTVPRLPDSRSAKPTTSLLRNVAKAGNFPSE